MVVVVVAAVMLKIAARMMALKMMPCCWSLMMKNQ